MPPRMRSDTEKILIAMGSRVIVWADIFAYYILWLTMTYFTDVWKISFTMAAAIINLLSGASQMLPVLLAHIADAFVGNFTVLLVSTLSYCVGLGLLALSTPPVLANHFGTCSEYKPECVGHNQKQLFYIGLGLISFGTAGHISSLAIFAEDQIDKEDRTRGSNIIQLIPSIKRCCAMFLGTLVFVLVPIIAIIVIPYVKLWSVRYEIAAIISLVSLMIFLVGCWWYTYVGPQGSPLTTIARVFVASTTKLFCKSPKNADQLYERNGPEDERLPHTNALCCLDKAAVVLETKALEHQERKRWRLCSITEVEETKIFVRMIPMWITFVACGIVSSVGNTYFVEQANHMSRKLGRLSVPLPVLLAVYEIAVSWSEELYSKLGGGEKAERPSRYAPPVGIAFSMFFAVLCCITAAKVEERRLGVAASHGLIHNPGERVPMSMFWLVPQFALLGLVDGMYQNCIESFFHDQVGPAMIRYLRFFGLAVFGSGIMGSAVAVFVVGRVSERRGMRNWFQHSLNESRLDRYYWVLAALSVVSLVVFVIVASLFTYRESRGEVDVPEHEGADGDRFEDNARCCC